MFAALRIGPAMSNEYIFFDEGLRERFIALTSHHGLQADWREDAMDGYVVSLADELNDALEEELEAAYDALLAEQRDLVDTGDGADALRVMGVNIQHPDGSTQVVRVPGEYALRLVEHFTLDEIRSLVTAIAGEVLAPHGGPLCKR